MTAYYNEFDPAKAAMLRQLIADGHIAPGDVDERSIKDVNAADLAGYTQCHFFAGIGGWSVALRLAGWPDDRSVWTGSCPCQPFSAAGKRTAQSDERHLWPDWYRLIRIGKPTIIFGEQVAAAITNGWYDDVCHGMEAENYAIAAAVLPACAIGKPHRRDRLWFVANAIHGQLQETGRGAQPRIGQREYDTGGIVANAYGKRRQYDKAWGEINAPGMGKGKQGNELGTLCGGGDVADTASAGRGKPGGASETLFAPGQVERFAGLCGDVANPSGQRGCGGYGKRQNAENANASSQGGGGLIWLECPDGKQRPVEPGIRLLAHGVQHRIPILHAFGDAIVPEVAAAFIESAEGWQP